MAVLPRNSLRKPRYAYGVVAVGVVYLLIRSKGSSRTIDGEFYFSKVAPQHTAQVNQHSHQHLPISATVHHNTIESAPLTRSTTPYNDTVQQLHAVVDQACAGNTSQVLAMVPASSTTPPGKTEQPTWRGLLVECPTNNVKLARHPNAEGSNMRLRSHTHKRSSTLNAFFDLCLSAIIVTILGLLAQLKALVEKQASPVQAPRPVLSGTKTQSFEPERKPEPETKVERKTSLTNSEAADEAVALILNNKLRLHALETHLSCSSTAVSARRSAVESMVTRTNENFDISALPSDDYDYDVVRGSCCENVIGFLPVPVGVAGPLNIDGTKIFLPMATTEGALVASTNRGCSALNASGGVTTVVLADGMTRGPCVSFPSLPRAAAAKKWLESSSGFETLQKAFNATSRFARLRSLKSTIAGSDLFIRFKASTGDAMGMNMISKGCEAALSALAANGFPDMHVTSLSGNYCTDKKAASLNWIDGRGKSVAAQAVIKASVLSKVLKIDVDSVIELNTSKNLIGSAMAGAMGGFNAHAANIVSAIFLATGQDIAQNVESSSCITLMKKTAEGDLEMSITMPSIEVGTVGGGTVLGAQGGMLQMLGVKGASKDNPGSNAQRLAQIVAAAVLAGELSLLSALASGTLVKSHLDLNRK